MSLAVLKPGAIHPTLVSSRERVGNAGRLVIADDYSRITDIFETRIRRNIPSHSASKFSGDGSVIEYQDLNGCLIVDGWLRERNVFYGSEIMRTYDLLRDRYKSHYLFATTPSSSLSGKYVLM